MAYRAGLVALIGRPNAGKSTLLNTVVGQKVAIVSDKAQTTRRRMLGIATTPDHQIVFVDTPGVHEAHTKLGRILNDEAKRGLSDVDVVVIVIDSSRKPVKEDEALATLLRNAGVLPDKLGFRREDVPVILCLNKMDLLRAADVADNVQAFTELYKTEQYMLTSMTKKQNIDKLVEMLLPHLPEQEPLFPDDEVTDQPMRFIAAELIREKALVLTRQEVPHALAVIVETWEEFDPEKNPDIAPDLVRIRAAIVVEKDGQKAIMIGKRGAMLKQIGSEARAEIEEMIGKRVYIELFVKVRADWRQSPRLLRELDYMPH